MTAFDAFHLPGFDAARPGVRWAGLTAGAASFRYPVLSDAELRAVANTVRGNAARLKDRSVHDVMTSIDRAANALTAPGALRDQALALLPETTRFSSPMVRLILDRMAAGVPDRNGDVARVRRGG